MSLIKFELTPKRIESIRESVKVMALMAKVIQMEYQQDMDVRFKNPMANQFAGRIIKDCLAIEHHLKNNDKVNIQFTDPNFVEEYAGELHRVIHFFIRLPLSQVKEVMDNLHVVAEMEGIEG